MLDGFLSVGYVALHHLLTSEYGKTGVDPAPRVSDVFLQQFEWDLSFCLIAHDLTLMEIEDVIGHFSVIFGGVDIPHDEDAVKSGKDG